MSGKVLEQVIIEAIVNAAVGVITSVIVSAFVALVINKLLVRIISYWLIGFSIIILSTGLFIWAYLDKINYWWIVGGVLGVFFTFIIYKRYYDFPFKKWHVTNNEGKKNGDTIITRDQKDNPGLLANTPAFDGIPVGKTWMFKAHPKEGLVVWGPYIDFLDHGKYKAVFKIKVLGNIGRSKAEVDIITIDVASCKNSLGDKSHVRKTLTSHYFRKANKYQKIHLDFRLESEERKIEFRVSSCGSEHIVILDYVELARRFF